MKGNLKLVLEIEKLLIDSFVVAILISLTLTY